MMYLIVYDIKTSSEKGSRRLRRIAKECCNYGQRVQNSVFECKLDGAEFVMLKSKLLGIMNSEEDSLRFYHLGASLASKVESYGVKQSYDPDGTLML